MTDLNNDVIAYFNRGNAHSRLGDQQGAIADYTQALHLNPNFAEAYSNRGVIYSDLRNEAAAIADYTQALQLNPDFAEAYNNRGNARAKLGDLPGAIEDLEKAATLFAKRGDVANYQRSRNLLIEAHFNMGTRFWLQDQTDAAISSYQKALAIKPDLPKVQYQLDSISKGYKFTTSWFTRNLDIWQQHLLPLSNIPGLNILEIGSWEGRSTCWLIDNLLTYDDSRITCIDTFEGSIEHKGYDVNYLASLESRFDYNINLTGTSRKVRKIVGNSHQILRRLPVKSYHLVYIDGSHFASEVLEDAVLSWGLLKLGGIMIFDDYDFVLAADKLQNPKVGIDAFISAFSAKIQLIHQSHQVIVKKTSH